MFRGRSTQCEKFRVSIIGYCAVLAFVLGLSGCGSNSLRGTSPGGSPIGNLTTGAPAAAVLGYVWDSRVPGLRTVTGVLGAAHLESGSLVSAAFTAAAPCAGKGFALLADATGAVQMMSLPGTELSRVADPIAKNEHIQLSRSCSNALIYAPGSSSVELISGLPSSPLVQTISIPSSGLIAGAAVGDTGSILFACLHADGSAAVQLLTAPGNQFQALATMQRYGGITFLPGGTSAVLADSGANTVTIATLQSSGPVLTHLASVAEGVSKPLAIAPSADGHFLFVANGSGTSILRFDLTGASPPVSTACACTTSELIPLSGNAIFQLNDPVTGTIFALEGDARIPRTIFIPTDKVGALSGGAQ
jgi:hypothetical protein